MNWIKWKERFERKVEAEVIGPLLQQFPDLLYAGVDFQNASLRVQPPDAWQEEELTEVETAVEQLWAQLRLPGRLPAWIDGPPSFPFHVHLRASVLPVTTPQLTDAVLDLELPEAEVLALRAAYEAVQARVQDFDVVATFASGGLPGLLFLTSRGSLPDRGAHLFPGLSWPDTFRPDVVLTKWLLARPFGERLLIFDTTGVGNAVNRVEAVLSEAFQDRMVPFAKIEVLGVQDRRKGPDLVDREFAIGSPPVQVIVRMLPVPTLIAEDVPELVGYTAYRERSQLEGVWLGSIVRYRGSDGRVKVVGGGHLSGVFQDALTGALCCDTRRDRQAEAVDAYMALLTTLGNSERRAKTEILRAFDNRLLTDEEAAEALSWLRKSVDAAKRRYGGYRDAVSAGTGTAER